MVHMALPRHTSSKLNMLYWSELVLEWHHLPPYYRALLASENCSNIATAQPMNWIYRYRSVRQVCPQCNQGWTGDIPISIMRLRKVISLSYLTDMTLCISLLCMGIHGFIIGWFFLDKSRPALFWMVYQFVNKSWDRGEWKRAKWLWAIPWFSLVHDISTV